MATPISIESFTTKNNKVDLVDAAHINTLQTSVVTLETALNKLLNTDGSIAQGTSYPGSPVTGQIFYRTDLGQVYIYSGSAWATIATLSNIQIFTASGTFTAPSGITKVYLTMIGGGGGGGGSKAAATSGSAGGTTSFDSVSVSGGNGGSPGSAGSGAGSSFDASGATIGGGKFKGGNGGTPSGTGQGGGGGAGEYILNYPFTVVPGNSYTVTIGAGGNGGIGSVGGGTGTTAGAGGGSPFGAGAAAGAAGGNDGASAAANSGAGGGGSTDNDHNGGNGGSGICIVMY